MRAALFPGQGIDAKEVAKALDAGHPRVQYASELLGYDLARRVEQTARRPRGVLPTSVAQPAIFTAGVVAFEAATERGETFDFVAGHSLGEYTALVAAGSIPFGSGVKLVAARGQAMERAAGSSSGGMAAVLKLTPEDVEAIAVESGLTVANDNSPQQIVLSGDADALAVAAGSARERGGRCVLLPVAGAFHSPAMIPAAAELERALAHTDVRCPSVPAISNVSARPYRAPGEIRKLLVEQLTGRVRWRESILYLGEHGVEDFVDVGPGDVVGRLARATWDGLEVARA